MSINEYFMIHSEFLDSHGYIVRLCLKKQKQMNKQAEKLGFVKSVCV